MQSSRGTDWSPSATVAAQAPDSAGTEDAAGAMQMLERSANVAVQQKSTPAISEGTSGQHQISHSLTTPSGPQGPCPPEGAM